ncbi:MAG TPA: cobalt ECF transporter T component CbiQ [Pseudonocardia sp.]|jgi:cobalt/nickel transport system permease protein|uniref:cobalt ECF transporter T component CbiQ n=1 Tax=Pseudonocardia sp. TaxID=60912 RepID=UPI002B4B5F8A|nr:cobalt ECF transporter T component CbiQ [Pseudonocardia sp.]HLU57976.1 cobalt ECF transporter T component CbiQ [Pseudonocardia sp.]
MPALDALACTGPWRHRHPGEKAVLAFGLLCCAVALPAWPGALVVGAVALALLLGPAGVGPGRLLRAVRAPLVFVVVGAVPLLFSVGGPGLVRFDPGGVGAALALTGRATAALLCLLLFAATTPLADALPRLARLGVPAAVVDVAGLVYRLLFLLLDRAAAVRAAQAGRLGFRSVRTTFRSVAGQAGAVFVSAFERARRMEQGLDLRGDAASLRVLLPRQHLSRRFLAATGVLLAAVVSLTLVVA